MAARGEAVFPAVVDVLLPYGVWSKPRPGLAVHHGRITAEDVRVVDGLRVLAPDLLVCELLCTTRSTRAALACADQVCRLRSGAGRAEFVRSVLDRLDRRADRRGTVRATALAELVTGCAESPPESWLRLTVVEHGFPPPAAQYEVCNADGTVVWRLDLAWPEVRVALEHDGQAAHVDRREHDRARDEDLRRRGWTVVHATAADLRAPGRLMGELAAAFRHRGSPLGATA